MRNRKRFTPEFRRKAVRLALTSGRSRREIANELKIGISSLARLIREERDRGETIETSADLNRAGFAGSSNS